MTIGVIAAGILAVGRVDVPCAVLDSGRRVFDRKRLAEAAGVPMIAFPPDPCPEWVAHDVAFDLLRLAAVGAREGSGVCLAYVSIFADGYRTSLSRDFGEAVSQQDAVRVAENVLWSQRKRAAEARAKRPRPPRQRLYAIRDGATGAVKFGVSAEPALRLATLQTGCPTPLSLVGHLPATRETESAVHATLAADRIAGEWFRPTPKVLRMVEAIVSGGPLSFEDEM